MWERVPSLNSIKLLESLPPRTLVRLKCMVADILDAEFYSAEFTIADALGNRRGLRVLYEDSLQMPEGFVEVEGLDHCSLLQRTSLVCIPVPGASLQIFQRILSFALPCSFSRRSTVGC